MRPDGKDGVAVVYWIAAIVAGLDQGIKWLIVTHMAQGQSIVVWPGVFEFLYVRNTGAAWSLFADQRAFLIAVALFVSAAIVFIDRRFARGKRSLQAALGLLLGGAVGNLIDRVARGYVIDYVYVKIIHYPVFNLADSAVVVSVLYLIVRAWRSRGEAGGGVRGVRDAAGAPEVKGSDADDARGRR